LLRFSLTEIPSFTNGQKLFTCDGDACTFIAPTPDGKKAVVQFEMGNELAAVPWDDVGPEEEAPATTEDEPAAAGADQ
jgi:hypothetical protein